MKIIERSKFILLVLALATSNTVYSKVTYVTVEVEGAGLSYKQAVVDGLTQAVSQVNGSSISGRETMKQFSMVMADDKTQKSLFAEANSSEIDKVTKGQVKNYTVVNKSQKPGSGWLVVLSVNVAKYSKSKQADRLRIAVLPYETDGSKLADQFSEKFNDKLVSLLTKTRKFAILDRDYQSSSKKELSSINSDTSPVEELARIGNKLSADYMLVGKIQKISISPRTITMKASGKKIHVTDYSVSIAYRIIDIATSQVKFSDIYSSSFTQNIRGGDVIKLVSSSSKSISRKIINAIYPIMVESVRNGYLYLGLGEGLITKGEVYSLIKLGEKLKDSYTGESLGREEIVIGTVKIVNVQPKVSKAKVIKSKVNIFKEFKERNYLLRPIKSKSKNKQQATSKKIEKESKKSIEDFEKASSSDW